jgi:DNA-binding MarR family transcriptional regulator
MLVDHMTRGTKSERDELAFRERLAAAKQASTLQLLFKAARLLDERAVARLGARHGVPLRRSHMAVLPHLDLEGTRVGDLAERLGVTKQAASQLVDDLEAFGVVERKPDPDDARARRVQFTKRGRDGFFEGLSLLGELEHELATHIGDGNMRTLNRLLSALLAAVDRDDR